MTFDPQVERTNLLGLDIPLSQKDEFAEALANRSLQGHGDHILWTCIKCYFVGLFDEGRALLPKARAFLRAAIEHKEIPRYYFPDGTEAARFEAFALCEWLISRKHDLASLKQAVQYREKYLSQPGRVDKYSVQLSLPVYLDAEEYETLIRRFEVSGLTAPKKLRAIQGEGTMSYVVARHRLGLQYSREEVADALQSFLKRSVPKLCAENCFDDPARWMKIAFWKPGDDPIVALLKCYDYLPGLQRPKYP